MRASVEGSDHDVIAAGRQLGFVRPDDEGPGPAAFVSISRLFAEPLRTRGSYDFASSELARRLRDATLEPVRRGWLPRPPTPVLFLHRKLAGMFLLCAHIGARVDCHGLYVKRIRD